MARAVPDLERRRAGTEATLARYRGKAFDWGAGVTCVHLARQHLRNLGHKPETLPRFRSLLAGRRVLAERGYTGVGDWLDTMLPRIAPAAMLPGDLATLPGEGGLEAVVIAVAPGKFAGWHGEAEGLVVIDVDAGEITGAWRC